MYLYANNCNQSNNIAQMSSELHIQPQIGDLRCARESNSTITEIVGMSGPGISRLVALTVETPEGDCALKEADG